MSAALPPSEGSDPEDVWSRVLKSALLLPGARIDRKAFLKKQLSKHVSSETLQRVIETTPARAGVPREVIDRIATSSIRWHRAGVTGLSFFAGFPGGWWIAGAVPVDLTQFFWHIVVLLQKLAYLYGWPEIIGEDDHPDDETLHILTIFIGVMLGAESASKVLSELAQRLAAEVSKRLPREALTKWGIFKAAREIAKWIGIKFTKDTFSRYLAKLVPIVSGFISGSITWISFSVMAKRLRKHLQGLALAE